MEVNMEGLLLEDFTRYQFLSDIMFSPDGHYTAIIGHKINLDDNKYISDIYLLNPLDPNIKKLTSTGKVKSFIWMDNNHILFSIIDREKDSTNFYKINIKDREKSKLFTIPLKVEKVKLIDSNQLVFQSKFNPNTFNQEDFQIIDEIPFWFNGKGFTNKVRSRLYLYNIRDSQFKPITDEFTNVNSFQVDKDKSLIVLTTNSFIDKKSPKNQLLLYKIKSDKLIKISPDNNFHYSYADFLDDKICFVASNMERYGINENPHFYLTDYMGQGMRQISPSKFDFNLGNTVGSDCRYGSSNSIKIDGDYIYFVTTEGDSSFINVMDINGNIQKLTNKKGSIDSLDVLNKNITFIGLRSLRLQEVYSLDNKKEYQLSNFNDWVMKEKTLSIPEKLTFRTEDETLIEGWVMKPVGFQQGETYPGILNIHGGPKTVYGEVFFHEMQYWANQGYLVFFCNPRGSDGRGNDFADIRGNYGNVDYEDIMNFTDLVLDKYPFIDRDRLGVTGGSYGGFMTNWIIGHTDRFKAAVSQRSISNWISKFATTDIGYYFVDDQIDGSPWEDFEKLWDSSPLKYANQVVTPTLFIHAEEDYRCWTAEAFQMFTALKYHGVEAKLCLFKGENHDLSRSGSPKSRIKRLKEITKWFDKYIKNI